MTWLAMLLGIGVLLAGMWWMMRQMLTAMRHVETLQDQKLTALRQEWSGTLTQTQQLLGERLEGNAKAMSDVHRKLGELEGRSQEILAVGKDIATLQDLLKAPKARGSVGELWLGRLLAEQMPREYFEEQYTFRSGERVDAVIKLGGRMVPVDAKFPLESFQRQMKATTDDERAKARREFERAVRTHIGAIAQKYILPDEGTYEFALMYIPAEQVYYETIIRREDGGTGDGLLEYALKQRVIPVSPNTFFAYLQVILLGLRGLSIEREASTIMTQIAQLRGDYERFVKDFDVLGKHVKDSKETFDRADRALERFGEKLVSVDHPQPEMLTIPTEVHS